MKSMNRNKRPFAYCLFDSIEPVLSDLGAKTGEKRVTYKPVRYDRAVISADSGDSEIERFGTNVEYDRVMIVEDPAYPVDENTVLFVEKAPEFSGDGQPLYDYIVKAVARYLNHAAYAIQKVKVS